MPVAAATSESADFGVKMLIVDYYKVAIGLALGIAFLILTSSVAASLLNLAGSSANVPLMVIGVLGHLPAVVVLTVMWSLVGGVYLLLRYDAGGQEVEDLWQPAPPPKPSFPKLPETNA